MDETKLAVFDASLERCNAKPGFLDLFYEKFLASSPKVKEKFSSTDFVRQKSAVRASFNLMMLAARDEETGPERHLKDLAARHNRRDLNIGSDFYDLWLDSLVDTVKEWDPEFDPKIEAAWESVMTIGIGYMMANFD